MPMSKNKLEFMKRVLANSAKVSAKLTDIGNELARRGRRHDHSYSTAYESSLIEAMYTHKDLRERQRCNLLLRKTHNMYNDYTLGFHSNDISKMNMLQLLELIAHRVVEYESMFKVDKDEPIDNYVYYILDDLDISDDLRGIMIETIKYFVDKHSVMKSIIEIQNSNSVSDEVVAEAIKGAGHGETKEE